MGGDRFSQNGTLQGKTPSGIFPRGLLSMSFPHNKPHSPLFSQAVLQELQSGLTQIPMRLCFALGLSARESLCAPFKNGVSISPSPVALLHTSPTGLQCQMLQGPFLPVPDLLAWGFDVGLRTLTPVGVFVIQTTPYLPGGKPPRLETNWFTETYRSESSEPHIKSSHAGIWHWEKEPQSIWH